MEEDLEPGLALDPASYVAKVMQKKRKEPPTESEFLSSVRKRPTTPPQEGASAGSPASGITPQGQVSRETLMEAVGTPPSRATGAVPAFHTQETTPGQTSSMDVSQPSEQMSQPADSQPTDQHPTQETAPVGAAPAEQSNTPLTDPPEGTPQEEMSEDDRLRQEKINKLTRIMLESIYSNHTGITPAAEVIHKAVLNFATYAAGLDQLAMAQPKLADYAGKCMANFYEHYAQRALEGYDDDSELVEAICVAHDAMPVLLPAAFAVCVEEEQKEIFEQSIEDERIRKERAEMEQRRADQEEMDQIQREIEEAERSQSRQPRQVNAADITQLMIGRMADLAAEAQAGEAGTDLMESLTRSLRSFFDQTSSVEVNYLTKTATEYVSQMRNAEFQRIRRAVPDTRAAMVLIKHAGKFITHLPDAIHQVLRAVEFNSDAPPMRGPADHPAEFEEEDVPEPQGVPSSGTPPGTPPPWNPREAQTAYRTGRVQEAVHRIEGPQTSKVPAPKWQGWKTQTGPTVADMEQSRMSPFGDQESEMPDPDLREAMQRSLHEMSRDPYEAPNTGGASGSGATTHHVPSPQQANTPNTQSEGEGSVIPNRPPRIAVETLQLHTQHITSADICLALEARIMKYRGRMAELIEKMSSMDQETTEADMNELNDLKQSVAGCQRSLEQARQGNPVQAVPRPPVRLQNIDPPPPGDDTTMERPKSRSRPRSHVRGRSKADKRRHPDSGDRRPSRRRKAEPIMVTPKVTIPRPTVASLFQGGAEDLSSSCPTSQEPAQSVPQMFQAAGAALYTEPMQVTPQRGMTRDQTDPPRDPRSQSERRRRVSIQSPPSRDDPPEGQVPVGQISAPFSGRPFQLRSTSAEPQLPQGEYPSLELRRDPNRQGRSTYYGR